MDYILFLKENDVQERGFLCTSRAEIIVLLDSFGMNPGEQTLTNGLTYIDKGQSIDLDSSGNLAIKVRIDQVTNGNVQFEYANLTFENTPGLSIPVRNVLQVVKNG